MSNQPGAHAAPKPPLFSNEMYDRLKELVQVVLPGLGTLYTALAVLWGFPDAEKVVGTIVSLSVFLGLVLKVAVRRYENSDEKYDGTIDISENEDGLKIASLNLKNYENPADVVNQPVVTFKVTQ